MRKTSVTVIAICATLLWLGEAHAELQTHATNPAVPEGTVYDTTTNLLWEMKSPAGTGGVHDVNNGYTWSVGTYSRIPPDGTVFKSFLSQSQWRELLRSLGRAGCQFKADKLLLGPLRLALAVDHGTADDREY